MCLADYASYYKVTSCVNTKNPSLRSSLSRWHQKGSCSARIRFPHKEVAYYETGESSLIRVFFPPGEKIGGSIIQVRGSHYSPWLCALLNPKKKAGFYSIAVSACLRSVGAQSRLPGSQMGSRLSIPTIQTFTECVRDTRRRSLGCTRTTAAPFH